MASQVVDISQFDGGLRPGEGSSVEHLALEIASSRDFSSPVVNEDDPDEANGLAADGTNEYTFFNVTP